MDGHPLRAHLRIELPRPAAALVRWFPGETGDITMIVVGATALEFVAGSFTPYAIDEAADRWLTD